MKEKKMFGKIFINSSIGVLIHIQAQTYLTLQLQVNILLKFVESGSGINILNPYRASSAQKSKNLTGKVLKRRS